MRIVLLFAAPVVAIVCLVPYKSIGSPLSEKEKSAFFGGASCDDVKCRCYDPPPQDEDPVCCQGPATQGGTCEPYPSLEVVCGVCEASDQRKVCASPAPSNYYCSVREIDCGYALRGQLNAIGPGTLTCGDNPCCVSYTFEMIGPCQPMDGCEDGEEID